MSSGVLVKGLSTWDNFREAVIFQALLWAGSWTPSDSATLPQGSRGMRFALGCVFLKGKGKKSLNLGYFKAREGGRHLFACICLGVFPPAALVIGCLFREGWWQRLCFAQEHCGYLLVPDWIKSPFPLEFWLPLGKCFPEQYLGWNFSNHITPCYKSLYRYSSLYKVQGVGRRPS